MQSQANSNQSEGKHIRHYLIWSCVNTCLGIFLLGHVAIGWSLKTKKCIEENKIKSAKRYSTATLCLNIFNNLLTIALLIYGIVYYVKANKETNSTSYYGK